MPCTPSIVSSFTTSGKDILKVSDTGTSQFGEYWNILEHYSIVQNVILKYFRKRKCYPEAYNTSLFPLPMLLVVVNCTFEYYKRNFLSEVLKCFQTFVMWVNPENGDLLLTALGTKAKHDFM